MSGDHVVRLVVNGESRTLAVAANTTLLGVLREQLGLTGAKRGCGTGDCGACTVLVDGEPAAACLTLAVSSDGRAISTVEGLEQGGKLHPIQEGFYEEHGLQCGFCTPGMMMTSVAFLKENPNPSDDEIRHAISGNLCRCTGYVNIVKAIHYAADKMRAEQATPPTSETPETATATAPATPTATPTAQEPEVVR